MDSHQMLSILSDSGRMFSKLGRLGRWAGHNWIDSPPTREMVG